VICSGTIAEVLDIVFPGVVICAIGFNAEFRSEVPDGSAEVAVELHLGAEVYDIAVHTRAEVVPVVIRYPE
jgi:hypothetical protein